MSKQEFSKHKHHAFGIPNPKLPPRNLTPSIQGDQRCSSPNCPNFATSRCNFCEMHCRKIHNGIHYIIKKSVKESKIIEDILEKYLNKGGNE